MKNHDKIKVTKMCPVTINMCILCYKKVIIDKACACLRMTSIILPKYSSK